MSDDFWDEVGTDPVVPTYMRRLYEHMCNQRDSIANRPECADALVEYNLWIMETERNYPGLLHAG